LAMKSRGGRERSPNHASAPEIMKIAGMPQGKVNATKTLRTGLRSWLDTSHVAATKTRATWYRKIP
jgi:hypothetical protein